MNNHFIVQAQTQASATPTTLSKPVATPNPASNSASVVIVTEAQPSSRPLLPAQMPLSSSSGAGSILDLAALALTLATFTAVVIAVVKK